MVYWQNGILTKGYADKIVCLLNGMLDKMISCQTNAGW